MRNYLIASFVLHVFVVFGQIQKTDRLIVSSDKFNILYANVDNPISISESFDSIHFEDGSVNINNSKIYLNPIKTGTKQLTLFKNEVKAYYLFRVEEIKTKPQVVFRRLSHSIKGRIQDKSNLNIIWDIDYEVKLKVDYFMIEVRKSNGKSFTLKNFSNRFNSQVLNAFRNLVNDDVLRIFKIKCFLPNGNIIYADDLEITI